MQKHNEAGKSRGPLISFTSAKKEKKRKGLVKRELQLPLRKGSHRRGRRCVLSRMLPVPAIGESHAETSGKAH